MRRIVLSRAFSQKKTIGEFPRAGLQHISSPFFTDIAGPKYEGQPPINPPDVKLDIQKAFEPKEPVLEKVCPFFGQPSRPLSHATSSKRFKKPTKHEKGTITIKYIEIQRKLKLLKHIQKPLGKTFTRPPPDGPVSRPPDGVSIQLRGGIAPPFRERPEFRSCRWMFLLEGFRNPQTAQ